MMTTPSYLLASMQLREMQAQVRRLLRRDGERRRDAAAAGASPPLTSSSPSCIPGDGVLVRGGGAGAGSGVLVSVDVASARFYLEEADGCADRAACMFGERAKIGAEMMTRHPANEPSDRANNRRTRGYIGGPPHQ